MLRLLAGFTSSLLGVLTGRLIAAQESPLDPTSPAFWTSFGIAGVVTAAFVRGWVVPGTIYQAMERRAVAAETAVREVTPALIRANETQDRMLEHLRDRPERKGGR